MQNIRIGTLGSIVPVGVNPSSPDRFPSWKTKTSAPNITHRLSTLSTDAFRGAITLPVMTNSTTKVTSTISAAIRGSLLVTPSR